MQLLYHVNLGPPLLGCGGEVVVAIDELAPRDEPAAADIATWNRYAAPQPGRGEQVHFARVRPDAAGFASALLVSPDGSQGARLAWRAESLPCFTLWKNQGGLADGYVTGLEPGTNYPNPRGFEEQQGRVVALEPGEQVRFNLELEYFSGESLAAAREAIGTLAAASPPEIHARPRPEWSAG